MGADGREYSFRSVDKDPSLVLDSLLRETIIADLVQDGISSAHPLGALVAAPLLDAVEVLHVDPQLWVMPDDPDLGEFRSDFAGVLGLIEENADENAGGSTSFRSAQRVVGSTTLMERIDRDAADAVDARAFLTARIVDVFLGDWDRHRDQWRWATFDSGDRRNWLPVPKDRDQAFSKFDGIAPRLVSFFMPQFVRFGPSYPNIVRLHWNGRELDRRFLSGLDRPVWDSIGAWVQDRLTDEVIEEAVNRLPPEILVVNGEELRSNLVQRRDRLRGAWNEFYEVLADKVDVIGTDADEVVIIDRTDSESVVVSIWHPAFGDTPYLRRRFLADETSEIRLYLKGGNDRVAVQGSGGGITVRIIGGEGDDRYQVEGGTYGLHLYDDVGNDTVSGAGNVAIARTPFEEWVWMEEDRDQPRDWGQRWTPVFWSSFASDLGLFIGGGVHVDRYGFRARPYSTSLAVRLGFSPLLAKGRAEASVRWNRPNSRLFATLAVRASGLDVIHYYGLGNDSGGGPEDMHQVDERTVSVTPGLGLSWSSGVTVEAGLIASASSASDSEAGFFASVMDTLYGATGHSQFGARGRVSYHPHADQPARRVRVRAAAEGTIYPTMADVESTFKTAEGEVSALFTPSSVVSVVLVAGGRKIWGRFPWKEAAFLGGTSTLPGWAEQRFAGDAATYVRGEARLRVFRPAVIVPVEMGVFGFMGAGRVYVDGSSPGGWHTSAGGGIWFTPLGQSNTLKAGLGVSEEATKLFVSLGFPY